MVGAQLQRLPARWFPVFDCVFDFPIELCRFLPATLQIDDRCKLAKRSCLVLRIFRAAECSENLELLAGKLLGFSEASLLDQEIGKEANELAGLEIVFAGSLETVQQRAAHIGLTLGDPALSRLHAAL